MSRSPQAGVDNHPDHLAISDQHAASRQHPRGRAPSGLPVTGPARPTGEFVALVALAMSLVAMSIDSMLPALPAIAADLRARDANDRQLVLTAFFAGLTVGQLFWGPLSDSVGRKRTMYAGILLFVAGGLLCVGAVSFPMMLAGRLLQGLGAASPRIISVAMVRDLYQGRAMARVMSFVMAVFILVPVLAPGVGQLVLWVASWRAIFGGLVAMALITFVWTAARQPETLPPERRRPLAASGLARAVLECVRDRATLGYTIATGLIFGAFIAYLATSQQIFQEIYGLGALFPVAFGGLAVAIGAASLTNARLVMRLGMRTLTLWALRVSSILSLCVLVTVLLAGGRLPLWAFMGYLLVTFFCSGLLFGNLNALAMAPMGHIAGVAAAVIGSLSSSLSLALGTPIGRAYDGTVVSLVAGFAALYSAALVTVSLADKGGASAKRPET
jgi:MFS transporter, DHA1 family, multidrug resistance protein